MRPRARRQAGFSLLELIIAVALAAVGLGLAYQSFGNAVRGVDASERHARALLLAESRLAELGTVVPLVVGETIGEAGEGYLLRVSVRPLAGWPPRPVPGLPEPEEIPNVEPVAVSVTVAWGPEERPFEVTLATLRLVPRRR